MNSPSSPLLPLLAIQTSSLAPSSLFHHIKSITIFSWFYLLNSSHSYSSSGCFRACLYHHSIFLAGFLASTPLFLPNPFSEIVAKVILKGKSNCIIFLLKTFCWLPTALGIKCRSLHMAQGNKYRVDPAYLPNSIFYHCPPLTFHAMRWYYMWIIVPFPELLSIC